MKTCLFEISITIFVGVELRRELLALGDLLVPVGGPGILVLLFLKEISRGADISYEFHLYVPILEHVLEDFRFDFLGVVHGDVVQVEAHDLKNENGPSDFIQARAFFFVEIYLLPEERKAHVAQLCDVELALVGLGRQPIALDLRTK